MAEEDEEPAAGIVCAPWHLVAAGLAGDLGPFGKTECYECGSALAYDVAMYERVAAEEAPRRVVHVCEPCSSHQLGEASDEQIAKIRAEFKRLRPECADMLDAFTNEQLREFFAKQRRPVQ